MVLTVAFLIISAVSVLSGLPALVIQIVYGKIFDPTRANVGAVPQSLLIPAELLQVFAQAAIGPLLPVLATVFYLDMRSRREGLDLELRLEGMK